MSDQLHTPAAVTLELFWKFWRTEVLHLPGLEPQIIQPVAYLPY